MSLKRSTRILLSFERQEVTSFSSLNIKKLLWDSVTMSRSLKYHHLQIYSGSYWGCCLPSLGTCLALGIPCADENIEIPIMITSVRSLVN